MPCCLSCRENVKIRAIIAALTVAEGSCETGENMGVRIFFWTILVVLTLSLSFLCILLDSCRPR